MAPVRRGVARRLAPPVPRTEVAPRVPQQREAAVVALLPRVGLRLGLGLGLGLGLRLG